ncbi:glycosyltransferase family 52 [Edwardsiella tarda]
MIHYVLLYVSFENVKTFDDGTLNISYDGHYYNERLKNNRLLNRVAHKVLHRRYDMERIKSQAIKHYTIYQNMDNIIKNIEFIEVFHRSENIISAS